MAQKTGVGKKVDKAMSKFRKAGAKMESKLKAQGKKNKRKK